MRLKDKVAIVTGASSGLGEAISKKFVAEGAKLVLSDINEEAGTKLAANLEGAIFIKCDTSDSSQVNQLVTETVEKFGKLDVMVNNAGVGALGGIAEVSDEDWDKVIGINLSGVFYGARAAARVMKERGIKGSIINMSSILGRVGMAGALSYCAAKGGVEQLTRAAALDMASSGVRVNAIAPAFIKTGMTKDVLADENFNNMIKANTPLGYVGEPNDIANSALYLASDEAKYVTGSIMFVDGGWTAH